MDETFVVILSQGGRPCPDLVDCDLSGLDGGREVDWRITLPDAGDGNSEMRQTSAWTW
jgi:hypothetical protein